MYDILIVGYGPVGATLANLLGRDGHRIAVIDKDADVYPNPRAIAFDHEIMRVFQSAELVDAVLPTTGVYRPARYLGADGDIIRRIDPAPPPFPFTWLPSYTFDQPRLERALRDSAEAYDNVDVFLEHEMTGFTQSADSVTAEVTPAGANSPISMTARYVVACDGASSSTRRQLGIKFEDLEFDEPWLVVDVNVSDESLFPDHNIQYCEPARPMTYVVGPDNHRRWEIMLLPGETADEIQRPERIYELLSRWAGPEVINVRRSAVYRFHALVAERWRDNRVLLAGDAVHQTPPFMGQGMCQGIRDADNLRWKLDLVLRELAGDELLDSYEVERKPHVRALTEVTKGLGEVICERDVERARARDRKMIEELESGRMVTVRQSMIPPLKTGLIDSTNSGPAGTLYVQPTVATSDGRQMPLFDTVPFGFLLVVAASEIIDDLDGDLLIKWQAVGGQIVLLRGEQSSAVTVTDVDGTLKNYFDEWDCAAVIVRPDRYVYGVAADGEGLRQALTSLLDEVSLR